MIHLDPPLAPLNLSSLYINAKSRSPPSIDHDFPRAYASTMPPVSFPSAQVPYGESCPDLFYVPSSPLFSCARFSRIVTYWRPAPPDFSLVGLVTSLLLPHWLRSVFAWRWLFISPSPFSLGRIFFPQALAHLFRRSPVAPPASHTP